MRVIALIIWICIGLLCGAAEPENPLQTWADTYKHSDADDHPEVAVTARYKRNGEKHLLAFKVVNLSEKRLEFYAARLPWGSVDTVTVAAITPDGEKLRNIYRLVNASPEKVRLAPGAFLEGDLDLAWMLNPSEVLPRKKDVLILWSYRSPVGESRAVFTGVTVIPRQQ